MSDCAIVVIWLSGSTIGVFGINGWISWSNALGKKNRDEFRALSPLGLIWPIIVPLVIATAIIGTVCYGFHLAVTRAALGYKARRERIALAEREAKRLADARRYEVERGPHR